ncbi:sulfur oxidation c-type cytochrome SoxX [Leptothrix discophora]|uniref:Sulfur oxidation c-type cytochrome SoxX n=1 Tax=Leptothrix discophora TaxID=89 RepID=A0ABT9G7Z8_LEPDI|nr:sulfur oxidation c-type cytochrome SoxX [Leptothrix discophora]MDP4302535.1 sulfur oxidation c-type cytochrome SoxX [Leptothrix discophora]
MKKISNRPFAAMTLAVVGLSGCATGPSPAELDRQATAMMKASFRDQGIAKVDRLDQDPANEACSQAGAGTPPEALVKAIEASNLATVKAPSDGRFLGDWKAGERLAQSGRGMTWTDPTTEAKDNGGNCYNCHQISKEEISYGTIGPSLYQYGKLRGVSDPASADARPIVEYTWGKLWNARAYNACSQMPRFGHKALLDERQLKDLMALLLDPKSPVNQ